MEPEKERRYFKLLSFAMLVSLVFLILLVAALAYTESQLKQKKLEINGKADVFSAKIHDLLQEHTFLLVNTARRSLDSVDSFNDSFNALQTNINEVSAQISTLYGPDLSNQFRNLWNTETNIFVDYTVALKSQDPSANSTFSDSISKYEEDTTKFWYNTSNSFPNLDKSKINRLVINHVNNVKKSVDYWNAKDYPNYFSRLHDSYVQTGDYADFIAQAMINANKNKFL